MTFVVKRDGREVGRFSAAQVSQAGATKFIFTLRDAEGKLVGSFYTGTEKGITCEQVLEEREPGEA